MSRNVKTTIVVDGSCSGNPGPGGWAAILLYGEAEKVLSGGAAMTTNNRMELTAVVAALRAVSYTHLDVYKRQLLRYPPE